MYLFGMAVLSVSGIMMIRWSLKYASVGKFTVVGALCTVVPLGIIVHKLIKAFRRTSGESNKPNGR